MSKSWPGVRSQVLERDEYTCQECDEPVGKRANPHLKDAEVHHITPRSEGGDDDPENLVTLCADCHGEQQDSAGGTTHPEEDYFEAIRANAPASTSAIAEAVGVTRQGADYRLRQLREEGKVEAQMVGNSLVWSLPNDATEAEANE